MEGKTDRHCNGYESLFFHADMLDFRTIKAQFFSLFELYGILWKRRSNCKRYL